MVLDTLSILTHVCTTTVPVLPIQLNSQESRLSIIRITEFNDDQASGYLDVAGGYDDVPERSQSSDEDDVVTASAYPFVFASLVLWCLTKPRLFH